MKSEWKTPLLEVLDVSLTMKWHHPKPPKGGGDDGEDDEDIGLS